LRGFEGCGSADGTFLAAPYYPGLYAFLHTRSPVWDLYFLWPRSEGLQQMQINELKNNKVSLILLNRTAAMDAIDALKIDHTYPELVAYITGNFARSQIKLPEGFEIYYSPSQCAMAPR
jgi:hypothetical protein